MENPITTSEIEAGIPEKYRCYFLVSAANLSRQSLPVIESLWEAVRVFAPAARLSSPAQIIIATRPFRITLSSGVLEYHPREETINAAVEHLVFLDVGRLMPLQRPLQVACIIEEFVHALMHVADEALVSLVVTYLYRGVVLMDGRYSPAAPSTT
ncbi:MAG: hypothetical protein H6966_00005 [Chromatiaceae bacterium]|nr:hypothetical protein [Chromatiaceae bacterium]